MILERPLFPSKGSAGQGVRGFNPLSASWETAFQHGDILLSVSPLNQNCKLNQLQLEKIGRESELFPSLLGKSPTERELQKGRKTTLGDGPSMTKGTELEIRQANGH